MKPYPPGDDLREPDPARPCRARRGANGIGEGKGAEATYGRWEDAPWKQVVVRLYSSFEEMVRQHAETGVEFWCARDLQMLLGYARWENFAKVIEKAKTACSASGNDIGDHFLDITKMIDLGKGAKRGMP